MSTILALDQGTTSSRAILFDTDGSMRGMAQSEYEQVYPQPGWVEHRPEDIWTSQTEVAIAALQQAGVAPSNVAAIGITNQRETTVVWNRATGDPIHNAIVWQDRRTSSVCERLRDEGHGTLVRERSGLVIDPYFSATKIAWLLDHVPGARAAARAGDLACGTIDTWLLWRLTGGAVHATDVSNASRTLLLNIHDLRWDEALLDLFDVPPEMLPEVLPSSTLYGHATVPGLEGTPIAGVVDDQQAALAGQTCFDPGMAKNTYGTGCFMLMNTGAQPKPSAHDLLTTIAWQVDGTTAYALEGSVFIGGAVVQWLRDGLGLIQRSSDIEKLAATVEDNGGVHLVPAFAGLGAPHWDPTARGTMIGLTRATTAGHVARAALESIAFQTADVLDAMREDAAVALPELRVDGGAAVNDGLMQFQADLLGVPIVRPHIVETTALGAAYLAGLAVGLWPDAAALRHHWCAAARFEPTISRDRATALRQRWNEAVERSRCWERT